MPTPQDWSNVDLADDYESESWLIDSLTFKELLLNIECNERQIDEKAVERAFRDALQRITYDAWEVFRANKSNITKQAIQTRQDK